MKTTTNKLGYTTRAIKVVASQKKMKKNRKKEKK
jgi:hypothetical protein